MVDLDAQSTYSNAILIHTNELNESVRVYPNPVANELLVNIANSNYNEPIAINMTDQLGRIVLQTQTIIDNTMNAKVNTSQLQSGIYFVEISYGNAVFKVKIIKL